MFFLILHPPYAKLESSRTISSDTAGLCLFSLLNDWVPGGTKYFNDASVVSDAVDNMQANISLSYITIIEKIS